jgi:hypothetical protein
MDLLLFPQGNVFICIVVCSECPMPFIHCSQVNKSKTRNYSTQGAPPLFFYCVFAKEFYSACGLLLKEGIVGELIGSHPTTTLCGLFLFAFFFKLH